LSLNVLTTSRPKLLIALSAALAALAISSIAMAGVADARGGGTPVGDDNPTSAPAPAPTANEAKYAHIWAKTPVADKRWAKSTSTCESGGNPRAIGGGGVYRGAFQFTKSTWRTSPKSPGGDPIAYTFETQAVVAVLLMHREGTKPWPVCG
jgi:transglycosylase-like protein